ncbi:DUF3331 domain-containing protein [Burkholderia guangdongensis]|uniref:DUF3331 domain-containing protein n=1 Tax=Burkholderia guangdongensis TaxID=1792500 RepID=UPI0015CA6709|nr:DUF3331 domain-containing protein [Burkholderia guangdongensis]
MQEAVSIDRVWRNTMALVGAGERPPAPQRDRIHAGYRRDAYHGCSIRILERQAATSATVAWMDATACCYGEQIWRRCIARRNGVCAISGQRIAKGDPIYRPRLVHPVPRNFDAMILASVIEAVPLKDAAEPRNAR